MSLNKNQSKLIKFIMKMLCKKYILSGKTSWIRWSLEGCYRKGNKNAKGMFYFQ